MLEGIFAAIVEFFANAPVPNILIIFGIFFILLVNIQSRHIAVQRKRFIFLFGMLLLAGGIGLYAAPLLPPDIIPPEIMSSIFGPATEEITVSTNETKKVFGGYLNVTPTKITPANVHFKISDCSNQKGLLYCLDRDFFLKGSQGTYRGQEYDYFIQTIQANYDSASLVLQIRQDKKAEQ